MEDLWKFVRFRNVILAKTSVKRIKIVVVKPEGPVDVLVKSFSSLGEIRNSIATILTLPIENIQLGMKCKCPLLNNERQCRIPPYFDSCSSSLFNTEDLICFSNNLSPSLAAQPFVFKDEIKYIRFFYQMVGSDERFICWVPEGEPLGSADGKEINPILTTIVGPIARVSELVFDKEKATVKLQWVPGRSYSKTMIGPSILELKPPNK